MSIETTLEDIQKLSTREEFWFDVHNPSILQWIFYILVSLLLLLDVFSYATIYRYILYLIVLGIGLLTWGYIARRITSKVIMREIGRYYHANNPGHDFSDYPWYKTHFLARLEDILLYFLGFNLDENDKYYIEANVYDVKLSPSEILQSRFLDTISASLGISVLITILITQYYRLVGLQLTAMEEWGLISIITVLSPMLIFWITPVIWTLEDAQIRTIHPDTGLDSNYIIDSIRKGVLSRLLGIGGILFGAIFLYGKVPVILPSFSQGVTEQLLGSLFLLMLLVLSIVGMGFILSIAYLVVFHETSVNKFRLAATELLPFGVTSIVKTDLDGSENETVRDNICPHCSVELKRLTNYCKECGGRLQ